MLLLEHLHVFVAIIEVLLTERARMERLVVIHHHVVALFDGRLVQLLSTIDKLLQRWWHEKCAPLRTTAGLTVLALARIGGDSHIQMLLNAIVAETAHAAAPVISAVATFTTF